jgi:hypothetical protein
MPHHHSRGWSLVDRKQAIQAHIVCSNEEKRNDELYGATKVFPFLVDAQIIEFISAISYRTLPRRELS